MTPADGSERAGAAPPPGGMEALLGEVERRERRARVRTVLLVAIPAIVAVAVTGYFLSTLNEASEEVMTAKAEARDALMQGPSAVRARVDPQVVDFGEVAVGRSAAQTVRMRNEGSVRLEVDSVLAPPSPALSLARDLCTGAVVSPGGECSVEFRFAPRSPGTFAGVVAIRYVGGDAVKTVVVRATTPVPTTTAVPTTITALPTTAPVPTTRTTAPVTVPVTGSPTRLQFADQVVGEASKPAPVTLTNRGNRAVTITGVRVDGPAAQDFAVAPGGCTAQALPPGQACTLSVYFVPSARGKRNASLRIGHDGASQPIVVTLTGTGRVAVD